MRLRGKIQMTVWRMRIECSKPRFRYIHSEYVKCIAFLAQQWLQERASMLRYTYIACLVSRCCTQESFYVTTCFGHAS